MLLPIILGLGKKFSKIIYIKGWSDKKIGIFSKIKLENTENIFNFGFIVLSKLSIFSNYLEGFYDLV